MSLSPWGGKPTTFSEFQRACDRRGWMTHRHQDQWQVRTAGRCFSWYPRRGKVIEGSRKHPRCSTARQFIDLIEKETAHA